MAEHRHIVPSVRGSHQCGYEATGWWDQGVPTAAVRQLPHPVCLEPASGELVTRERTMIIPQRLTALSEGLRGPPRLPRQAAPFVKGPSTSFLDSPDQS